MKTHSGIPTQSWWKAKVEVACFGLEGTDVKRYRDKWTNMHSVVNLVLTEFIMLIDFPEPLFRCCQHPEVICVDGIVLSIENRRIKERNFSTPWREDAPTRNRASTRSDRNVWDLKQSIRWKPRELLRQFALRNGGLKRQELVQLIRRHPGPLSDLLNLAAYPVQRNGSEIYVCPSLLQPFFHSASKPISPAIGVVPKVLWHDTAGFLQSKQFRPEYLNFVREHSSLLNSMLTFMLSNQANQALMNACYGVIKHCLVIAYQSTSETLQKYNVVPLAVAPTEDSVQAPTSKPFSARDEYGITGFFFPGRPLHSRIKNCILSKTDELESPCNKDYKEAGKYGAGMALFWCGTHRECIGWILL